MEWQFLLDSTEIDEPIGFADIVFNVLRDENWHGVMFEASTSSLKFYMRAFDYLQTAKKNYGVDANVIFTAKSRCSDEEDFETAMTGKLNFAKYSESCGSDCFVTLPVEQTDCTMLMKNRFDQKVSIDSQIAFDKLTVLQDYTGLGITMQLASQAIPISADASVAEGGDTTHFDIAGGSVLVMDIRPIYGIVRDNSIHTGQLNDPSSFYQEDDLFLVSPQVLNEESEVCLTGEWTYDIRMKGTVTITGDDAPYGSYIVFGHWDGNGLIHNTIVDIVPEFTINSNMSSGTPYTFDRHYTGTVTLPPGVGVYALLKLHVNGPDDKTVDYTFDPETSFFLGATKTCPPTDATVYLVNETLSRITESITNRCLTVKSDYYGRTDSQPYTSNVDGCGSLRVLTSGLKIRQAADKEFFASLKDVLEGLKCIDNIGMGIEVDRLRIEPVKYFYNEFLIMNIDLIPEAQKQIVENLIYSLIKTGYKKWEIKSVKGIDEFNSTKEFRTSITSVSKTLDIQTDLISSGYIIEQLRTSTLANSGNADSTYDNDIFIICTVRAGYGWIVEQNVAENVTNVFSPATMYNWRIRPLYNLMRWAKSVFPSYANLINSSSKIFFSEGKGNYTASGNLPASDDCRLENTTLAENVDLSINLFENVEDYTPIWKPETISFDYELSIKNYNLIKANPYGYINLQCGQGDFIKAYIKTVEYTPAKGMAKFTLLLKWQ